MELLPRAEIVVIIIAIVIIAIITVVIVVSVNNTKKSNTGYHVGGFVSTSYFNTLYEVTTADRGTDFEKDLIVYLIRSGISPKVIFHDLYVPTSNGKYAQIDLVVVTSVGIIVIEVKDYGGWIFGTGNQQKWTQVLAYGREKYRFYNPILQNASHIHALKRQSFQFSQLPFFSIVVFSNHCELRDLSFIPKDTFVTKGNRLLDVINHIKVSYPKANYTNKYEVVNILRKAVVNGVSMHTQKQHIENIHDMLGKDRVFD